MTRLKPYRGYTAELDIDVENNVVFGRVIGLKDVIHFEGSTPQEAESEYHASVDDYLEWCKEIGEEPEKPYSGKVMVRMDPELHRKLARQAERETSSINSVALDAIEHHLSGNHAEAYSGRTTLLVWSENDINVAPTLDLCDVRFGEWLSPANIPVRPRTRMSERHPDVN